MPQRHFFDAYKSGAITNFKPSLSSSGNILLSQGQKQPSQLFFKIGVLKYLGKFTGKYICQSLLFIFVAGLQCFPVNFAKHLRTNFS